MVRTYFDAVGGERFFYVVGAKRSRAYAARKDQEEIYCNGEISLHTLAENKDGDWVGCRIYLLLRSPSFAEARQLSGDRRTVWHFGVSRKQRRASRVSDFYDLKSHNPAVIQWAVDFICGDRREAPPWSRDDDAEPTADEYLEALHLILGSSRDGVGWSLSKNTRRYDRYVVDNLKAGMRGVPVRRIEKIVLKLLMADVIRTEVCDTRAKRKCLMVNRSKIDEFMDREGFTEEYAEEAALPAEENLADGF